MSDPKSQKNKKKAAYKGFEQGSIRPPSEARSLLVRITRNCPWNRCTFCPVYKDLNFSLRPVDHVIRDIDAVWHWVEHLAHPSTESEARMRQEGDGLAFYAARQWVASGMKSIFLQDANSLILPPADLLKILRHLQKRFPDVERITSYARAHTVARISDKDLGAMREAGLNRIHIGLESGSDKVLERVRKGVTKEIHIRAGLKIKKAAMELSEYVMPGLGGRELSEEHALETADALNKINPDFIRLRTLAVPRGIALWEEIDTGTFEKLPDREIASEILLFIENLDGITSRLVSDHILNLFQEIDGKLPQDKERMVFVLQRFLSMSPSEQIRYQVGRRLGLFSRLDDMESPRRRADIEKVCEELGVTPDNVDQIIDQLMNRFI